MPPAAVPFGNYLLLERLAIGGMAEVYLARSSSGARGGALVAVKRILPSIVEDHEFVAMFIDEAKIAGQLSHANIARIFDLGKIHSSYFIAMEYVPGPDLRALWDLVRYDDGVPLDVACLTVCKICDGLDYAHRRRDGRGKPLNIIHRDISPQNVLISFDGDVKIIDFGIAKARGRVVKTQTGVLKGKFAYMAPEQARGEHIDNRVDIFAVGVILYELCTGQRLYQADTDFALLEKVRKVDFEPPSRLRPDLPPELERIILKALARDINKRYAWASAMLADLERFMVGQNMHFGRADLAHYVQRIFADDYQHELNRLQEYRHVSYDSGDGSQQPIGSRDTDTGRGLSQDSLSTVDGKGHKDATAADITQVQVSPFEGELAGREGPPTEVVDAEAMLDEARRDLITDEVSAPADEYSSTFASSSDRGPPPYQLHGQQSLPSVDSPTPTEIPDVAAEDSLPPPFISPAVLGGQHSGVDRGPIPLHAGESLQVPEPSVSALAPEETNPHDSDVWRERGTLFGGGSSHRLGLVVTYIAGVLTVLVVLMLVRLLSGPDSGHLVVITQPTDTRVEVDDKQARQQTPAQFELSAGAHVVRLLRPGVPVVERRVEIAVNKLALLKEVMPQGHAALVISSDPAGASVLLDGDRLGLTPLTLDAITADRPHELRLTHKLTKERIEEITLAAGEHREIHLGLPYRFSRIKIESTPEDAVLYWQGRWRRSHNINRAALKQTYSFSLQRPGCQPHVQEVTPQGERDIVVAAQLDCGDFDGGGRLTITGPYRGRVVISNIDVGRLPLLAYRLPVGTYQVQVRGRRSVWKEQIDVGVGQNQQRRVRVR